MVEKWVVCLVVLMDAMWEREMVDMMVWKMAEKMAAKKVGLWDENLVALMVRDWADCWVVWLVALMELWMVVMTVDQ